MTQTYTSPAATDRDRVRLLIGDTGPSKWHLTDEEITDLLALSGSGTAAIYGAASKCARAIGARRIPATFALSGPSITLDRDPVYQNWIKLAEHYEEVAKATPEEVQVGWEDKDISEIETFTGAAAEKRDDVKPSA